MSPKVGNQRIVLRAERFMVPGEEQTLDDLIALAPQRGWVILRVDREQNRLLVGVEDIPLA